jgi:hypothetical protein
MFAAKPGILARAVLLVIRINRTMMVKNNKLSRMALPWFFGVLSSLRSGVSA